MKKIFATSEMLAAAPNGEVVAVHKGKKVYQQTWGKKYSNYDLASLTKILFTNELILHAQKNKLLNVNNFISKHLPYWPHKVKIKNLLRHDSGYTWWKPFYKNMPATMTRDLRYTYLQNLILKESRAPLQKSLYSDLNYFILGFVLEAVYNKPLEAMLDIIDSPFHFNVDNKVMKNKTSYAPTEKCQQRKKRLQGEVHDLNAWALGGVAPHAGLFGGTQEMLDWFLAFRKKYRKQTMYKNFTKRAIPESKGDWALGYMLPTIGKASCGDLFSAKSFGHTGFTGTSFWYDPTKDFAVILLTNRVYYGVNHHVIRKLRPMIHNRLYKEFV